MFHVKHLIFRAWLYGVAAIHEQQLSQPSHGSVSVAGQHLPAQGPVLLGRQSVPGTFQAYHCAHVYLSHFLPPLHIQQISTRVAQIMAVIAIAVIFMLFPPFFDYSVIFQQKIRRPAAGSSLLPRSGPWLLV
jgi:hypothetical protein